MCQPKSAGGRRCASHTRRGYLLALLADIDVTPQVWGAPGLLHSTWLRGLVHALAAGTERLADPTDLPVTDDLLDEAGMPDPEKVEEAVSRLIEAKPHLASSKYTADPRGDYRRDETSRRGAVPGPAAHQLSPSTDTG